MDKGQKRRQDQAVHDPEAPSHKQMKASSNLTQTDTNSSPGPGSSPSCLVATLPYTLRSSSLVPPQASTSNATIPISIHIPITANPHVSRIFLSQGAEATLYLLPSFLGRSAVLKERIPKQYRHPELENRLRARRLVQEVRCMTRCRMAGVSTPTIYMVQQKEGIFYMEYLEDWITLKQFIWDFEHKKGEEINVKMLRFIGQQIALIHDQGIVHGDLTTSNIMVNPRGLQGDNLGTCIRFIDFGLSYHSKTEEDKGVDLYVLERAVQSAHSKYFQAIYPPVIDSYAEHSKNSKAVLKKLADIRMRGRKRTMVG